MLVKYQFTNFSKKVWLVLLLLFSSQLVASSSFVKGHIDRVTSDTRFIYVRGWACHIGKSTSISVNLYALDSKGKKISIQKAHANLSSESGVSNACQSKGGRHRFQFKVAKEFLVNYRNRQIYVGAAGEYRLKLPQPIRTLIGYPKSRSGVKSQLIRGNTFFYGTKTEYNPARVKDFVEYQFWISKSGYYQINANVISPDGGSDSFYVKLDRHPLYTWHTSISRSSSMKNIFPSRYLTRGTHTARFYIRENHTRISDLELLLKEEIRTSSAIMVGNSGKLKIPYYTDPKELTVRGAIWNVWQDTRYINVSGWACQGKQNKSIAVHLYAGGPSGKGQFITSTNANLTSNRDVGKRCSTSLGKHVYIFQIDKNKMVAHRNKPLYIHGIRVFDSGWNNLLWNSGKNKVPNFTDPKLLTVKGAVWNVTQDTRYVHISGWACQGKQNQSIAVHLYAGGPAGKGQFVASTSANQPSGSDVAKLCDTSLNKHVYRFKIDKSKMVAHRNKPLYVHGIRVYDSGWNNLLWNSGVHKVPNFTDPRHLIVRGDTWGTWEDLNYVYVSGWACQGQQNKSISVSMYAGGPFGKGQFIDQVSASLSSSSSVGLLCGTNLRKHRFLFKLDKTKILAHRNKSIHIQGNRVYDSGWNYEINRSGQFKIPNFIDPKELMVKGNIDHISTDTFNVYVGGWACQGRQNQSLDVHLYLGGAAGRGKFFARSLANQNSEYGVSKACGTSLNKHRFKFKLAKSSLLKYRNQPVYIHGIKKIDVGYNHAIGSSGKIKIPNFIDPKLLAIKGNIDRVRSDQKYVYVGGWACQQRTNQNVFVDLYVKKSNGKFSKLSRILAKDRHESGVMRACSTSSKMSHRFMFRLAKKSLLKYRGLKLYAYGNQVNVNATRSSLTSSGTYAVPNFSDSRDKVSTSSLVSADFTSSSAAGSLSAFPNVCEFAPGMSTCEIKIKWQGQNSNQTYCVFIKESQRSLGCGQRGLSQLDWITKDIKTLQLIEGSTTYNANKVVASLEVFGINKLTPTEVTKSNLVSVRPDSLIAGGRMGGMGSTWDGRIYFEQIGLGPGLTGVAVKVFRPEVMSREKTFEENLENNNVFSNSFWAHTHKLTNDEYEYALTLNSASKVDGNFRNLNLTKINSSSHIAVFPIENNIGNPYPSEGSGDYSEDGFYLSYDMFAITATTAAPNGVSQYPNDPTNPEGERKHFLAKYQMKIIVKNPYTVDAEIHKVIVGEALGITDKDNNFLYGYEPSATLDGRLIVFSGNPNPRILGGNGGNIQYTFQANRNSFTGYTRSKNLLEMYSHLGPGANGGEYIVNGKKFSDLYPIAKKQIKTFEGITAPSNSWLKGAYPWISFRGSEVFYQSVGGFDKAARFGATIVGARTKHILQVMDGQVNQSRGNPTDNYGLYPNSNAEGAALDEAYQSMVTKNLGEAAGKGFEQVLYVPVAQNGTSWSPFLSKNIDKKFPIAPFQESYSFFLTGDRYFEYTFPEYSEDLLVHMPMQEPVRYDFNIIKDQVEGETFLSGPEYTAVATKFSPSQVADYSGYFQTGELFNNAFYPFEKENVKQVWADTWQSREGGILLDRNDGAIGNSIMFYKSGKMELDLKLENITKIQNNQAYTIAFWIRKNALQTTGTVINIPNLFKLEWNNSNLEVFTYTSSSSNDSQAKTLVPLDTNGATWNHVAVSMRPNGLGNIFINGEEITSIKKGGNYLGGINSDLKITVGPNNTGSGGYTLSFDEFHLYSIHLQARDIEKLAWQRREIEVSHDSFFAENLIDEMFGKFIDDENWGYTVHSQKRDLGFEIFQDRNLSVNRSISCASCHLPEQNFASNLVTDSGVSGEALARNTPSLLNVAFNRNFMADGSIQSIESQVLHPIINQQEMGLKAQELVDAINANQSYRSQIQSLYGKSADLSIAADLLGHFVRSIASSPNEDDLEQLSDSAKIGKRLFNGKANCIGCHKDGSFSDYEFHNIVTGDTGDEGRSAVINSASKSRSFRTPALRGVKDTGPYFHDGRFTYLKNVVNHYNDGNNLHSHPSIDKRLRPLELSEEEKDAIVEYLKAL